MNLNIKTLDQIGVALDNIEEARADASLNSKDKTALEAAAVSLRSLERSIIRSTELELVAALKADSTELQKLVVQIKASAAHLAKVSATIEKASKAVEALISIMITAAKAGLL